MDSDSRAVRDRCGCRVALKDRLGQAYNEEAFLYFLAIERKRSERSGHPFALLLVDVKEQSGGSACIDITVARELFSGLLLCLRETDFIGWYREERVAGALLAELGHEPGAKLARVVIQRVSAVLCERLSSDIARRLQVRIYQYPAAERSDSGRPQVLELN
jgi:PleD family two-component response regulator